MAEAIPALSWPELLLRLAVAAALGAAVGVERELRERQAGLRTHLLVSVGAALFTIVSAYAWSGFTFSKAGGVSLDPSRVAAGIVTGIGFLGAGAIIREGHFVRGLTTAASLWVVAAIGLASGAGYYEAAAIATAIVVVSLWPLRVAARPLVERFRPEETRLVVELRAGEAAPDVLAALEDMGGKVELVELDEAEGRRLMEVDVRFPHGERERSVARLSQLEHVVRARWGR